MLCYAPPWGRCDPLPRAAESHAARGSGGPAFAQDWTLDAVGNWSAFDNNGSLETRTHNALNQLTGRSSPGERLDVLLDRASGQRGVGVQRPRSRPSAWPATSHGVRGSGDVSGMASAWARSSFERAMSSSRSGGLKGLRSKAYSCRSTIRPG